MLENARWSAYTVTPDGWLVAHGGRTAPARVTVDTDVVSPFAAVIRSAQRLDEAVPRLQQFVEDFGLLTGQPHRVDRPAGGFELRDGDPISWSLSHSAQVNEVFGLIRGRREGLDHRLQVLQDRQREAAIMIPTPTAGGYTNLSFDIAEALTTQSPLAVARLIVAEMLAPNLAGVVRVFDAETATPRFHFRALIDVIYWLLADRLEGRWSIRQCACGALFFARDPRQRHCPPRPGQRESACTKRFRMRQYRKGKKEKVRI